MDSIIINHLVVFIFCFVLADWQAHLIKQNRPIKHGWWMVLYYTVVGIVTLIARDYWLLATATLFRAVIFDSMLSFLRGLEWDYQSGSTTSVIDGWEKKIFEGNFLLEKGVYLIILFIVDTIEYLLDKY